MGIKTGNRLTHTPWDTLRWKPPPGFDLLYSLELSAIVTSIAHSACWNIALLTMKVAAILTLNGTLTSASYHCTSPNSTSRRKMAFCAMVSSKAESTSQKNHARSLLTSNAWAFGLYPVARTYLNINIICDSILVRITLKHNAL